MNSWPAEYEQLAVADRARERIDTFLDRGVT
jgi:hypothetical protein